jgi:hypothetical protein
LQWWWTPPITIGRFDPCWETGFYEVDQGLLTLLNARPPLKKPSVTEEACQQLLLKSIRYAKLYRLHKILKDGDL